MQGMYINRHNEAVWIIMRHLLNGRLGASVVMHDAGHKHDAAMLHMLQAVDMDEQLESGTLNLSDTDTTEAAQPAQLGTRIPAWVYDTPMGQIQDAADWNKYRPDIMIATPGNPNGDRIQQFYSRAIHIIEVKYCRDTDRSVQSLRARQQHDGLHNALLRIGYQAKQIHLHVITLGATGTIYNDLHDTLGSLGLDSKRSRWQCCAELHKHAVTNVMTIMKTKWAQERKKGVG
jgi:hypothetical protein